MKATLHYRAGPNLLRMIGALPEGVEIAVADPGDDAALTTALADSDMLLHVLEPVTAAMMDAAPRLKLIQKIGVGIDAIDVAAARAGGIAVCNIPGANTAAVAEMTLALIFACLRRIPLLSAETKAGTGWTVSGLIGDGLGELGGRTVGLVGYGAVARRLAPVLTALGAKVVAFARRPAEDGTALLPLDELLHRSDIVSLHLPVNDETRNLLDARRIGLMKPGAILVNTARGGLVDQSALVEALRDARIAAAGLDVFAAEPPLADDPLLALPNVVATPHVAWLTGETLRRSLEIVVENARRLAAGEPLLHRVA